MVSLIPGSGPIGGAPIPGIMSGAGIRSPYFVNEAGTNITTTSTRLYYIPIYLDRIFTFAGIKTRNGGTGDNGDTYRVGLYAEATAGGPGALVNDCGEITLDASASIVRTASSSFSTTTIGWHYLAFHSNQAVSMNQCTTSPGGNLVPTPADGLPTLAFNSSTDGNFAIPYVDTTYGALASTAVAPTASTNAAPVTFLFV